MFLTARPLELLDLSRNDLGDEGFEHLAAQLIRGAVIKRYLFVNNILYDVFFFICISFFLFDIEQEVGSGVLHQVILPTLPLLKKCDDRKLSRDWVIITFKAHLQYAYIFIEILYSIKCIAFAI